MKDANKISSRNSQNYTRKKRCSFMLKPIFTLDYEIHGNGNGSPLALMVEPTDRLLRLFDEFGAKLTIMADVAEILRFKEYLDDVGRDDFHAEKIERQLQDAIQRGHDVQLHIHSSYFRAFCENGHWIPDWSEYDFARLPLDRMDWMVAQGKQYLESLLRPVDPAYRCEVFRAANWSMSPSTNVVKVLLKNDIRIDTSVFKYGYRNGHVQFDYSSAVSELVPWRVHADNVCAQDDDGRLWEFPIYSESRGIASFITPQRLHRAFIGRLHRLSSDGKPASTSVPADSATNRHNGLKQALGPHAWKADFNQCTGHQLISAISRAEAKFAHFAEPLPFVLIGHSKLFTRFNEWSLRPFLSHIRQNPDRFRFGKFTDFPLSTAQVFGKGDPYGRCPTQGITLSRIMQRLDAEVSVQ
jgi:hypothetical protein